MATLCNASCPTDQLTQMVTVCIDTDNLLEIKANKFAFIECAETIISLSSELEWTALKTAGALITTPKLSEFSIPEPTATKGKFTDCAPTESVLSKTQKIDINTLMLDLVTNTDEDFIDSFYKKIPGYTMILGSCVDNTIFYRKQWATGENPGFGGLVGDLNYVTKEISGRKYMSMMGSIEFDLTRQTWGRIKVSDAVFTAIFG